MRPVFIFGAERSGTTLLGSILGSHSSCVATPESQFVWMVNYATSLSDAGFQLEPTLKRLQNNFRFRLWNIEATEDRLKNYQVTSYAELILAFSAIYAQSVGRPQASVWIDHSPTSYRYAAFLSRLFPDARFIHLVRDGRAVVASVRSVDWGNKSVHILSGRWAAQVCGGAAAETFLGQGRVLRVHYEALVQHPEETARQLCAHLDLNFEPEMVGGKGFSVPQYTQSQHALVGQLPDPKRIDSWRTTLSPKEIASIERYTNDVLLYFGYDHLYEGKGVVSVESPAELARSRMLDRVWFKWRDRARRQRKRQEAVRSMKNKGYLNK